MMTNIKPKLAMLLIIFGLIYVFWIEIGMAALKLYSYTGSPMAERLLGEYYYARSELASSKAAMHFEKSLVRYKLELADSSAMQRKQIEYIIGNHYECGKGVDSNLEIARKWYKDSAAKGYQPGIEALKRIRSALEIAKKSDN